MRAEQALTPGPSPSENDLNGDEAIALLESLVSIPSTSYRERRAVECLTRWMSEHGAVAHIDGAGNAVGIFGAGSRRIVLLGHIDTVGGLPPVRREGSQLYGRGTVDAKGPLCAFAAAAAGAQIPEGWQVIVIGAVEEECPTSAGAHYAVTQYTPELCVIGEPSRWDRLTLGYKGRLLADFDLSVPITHSASRSETAAEHAVEVWTRVRSYAASFNQGRERAFERLDATLMHFNTSDDGLNGHASMRVGFRLPLDVTPDELEAAVREMTALTPRPPLPQGEGLHAGYRFNCEFSSHTPTFAAPRDTSLSRLFRSAIRAEGGAPAFVMKTGTSDMNVAGPAWGCPILAYGPGDSALDHTPDEHIDLDEYARAIRVLTRVIESLETQSYAV